MNRTRLVFIGILALAVGAFASALAYRILQSHSTAADGGGQEVVVATDDLTVGTRIQEKDVRVVRVPTEVVPPGSYRQKSRVVGRGVVQPIAAGEFVLPSKLAAENGGSGLPSLSPPGVRAVSLSVARSSSAVWLLLPG